jgi:class 3 adenylate cyclase
MAALPIKKALLLFSDIIDSSVYSSILGIEQYAKDILKFQRLFKDLAERHFKKSPALRKAFIRIGTGGDEGTIFLIADESLRLSPGELIYRAIQFAFELKALLELVFEPETDVIPRKMHVGTGIHFGDVATVLRETEQVGVPSAMTEIHHIEGYAINYAKRIESATRLGKYSQVFLSKAASAYIWDYPIVLEKHRAELKGISKLEDVSEVRSAFFREMPLDYPPKVIEQFIIKYVIDPTNLDFINEPWLKSFSVSVLDSVSELQAFRSVKKKYQERQKQIAWHNHAEDDPILLFIRALDCEARKQHTKRLSILKEIISAYPSFIYARKEMVKAIADLIEEKCLPTELVYAKDIAEELLEHYSGILKSDEIGEFKKIIEKIKPVLKGYGN